jgi:uncharacterized protein with HEPN domain
MLDAARAVHEFVQGRGLEEYLADRMLRSAVERHLEIMGEAARRVSPEFRSAHPEIPWRGIIGQRNVLIHEYGEIQHEMVWRVAREHIPALITALEPLVREPPAAKPR